MLFNSRGFKDAAAVKGDDLEQSLVAASQGGKIPIVCDTSPCLSQIKGSLSDSRLKCAPFPLSLATYLECLPRWLKAPDHRNTLRDMLVPSHSRQPLATSVWASSRVICWLIGKLDGRQAVCNRHLAVLILSTCCAGSPCTSRWTS